MQAAEQQKLPLHCIVQTAMRQKLQCSKSTITNIINLKLAVLYYYEAVWTEKKWRIFFSLQSVTTVFLPCGCGG
jgi:hypothetical protein